MNKLLLALPALALLAACGQQRRQRMQAAPGSGAQITGAGSTFVYPVLSAWAADYQKQAGDRRSTISRSARAAALRRSRPAPSISARPTSRLHRDELAKNNLAQFPIVVGGIVPVVNIAGHRCRQAQAHRPAPRRHLPGQDQELERSGDREDQPGREPPERGDRGRPPFGRFGHDLQLHPLSQPGQPDLEGGPGEGKTVNWTGGVGGKGNEGVAGYVKQLPNSIGYVEYAYVVQNHMTYALLQNAAGNFVAPSADCFAAAAANADWKNAKDFNLVMTNAPGAQAYPIAASTFILLPKQPKDKAKSDAADRLLQICAREGPGAGEQARLRPAAADLVQQIESYIVAECQVNATAATASTEPRSGRSEERRRRGSRFPADHRRRRLVRA